MPNREGYRPEQGGKLRGQEMSKDGNWINKNRETVDMSDIIDISEEEKKSPEKAQIASAEAGTRSSVENSAIKVAEQNKAEQREKSKMDFRKIVDAKIAAGMDANVLEETLMGELDETEALIEELEDDEAVLLDEQVGKRDRILAQLERIQELKKEAA